MKVRYIIIILLILPTGCSENRYREEGVFFTNPEDGSRSAVTLLLPKAGVNIHAVFDPRLRQP